MRISDWSSDVCSSDLRYLPGRYESRLVHAGKAFRKKPDRGCASMNRKQSSAAEWQGRRSFQPRTQLIGQSRDSRAGFPFRARARTRSEEHTSELQSLMRISYAVFCLQTNKLKRNR